MKTLRILFLAVLFGGATTTFAAEEVVNGIAVLVNDTIITHQDVALRIGTVLESLDKQFKAEPATPERRLAFAQKAADIERDGLDQLIQRQLVLSEYKIKGYNLPESLINEEVERRIRDKFHDRVEFIKTLKGESTTFEAFRGRLREDFIYSAMRFKNVSQDLIISPAKIEHYYSTNQEKLRVEDQVKLRMIVIKRTRVDDGGTARKRAEEIQKLLNEGADFGEMAQVYSEGSQSAQRGDWGWVEKSVLDTNLVEVAFRLQTGQRSGVIESPDAYCLMLVEDKRAAHVKPISEVRDEIEKTLLVQEQARLEKAWIERLKNKAFIRYF